MPRKDWESLRQKRQTKFQQGQKRAGKVQEEQELANTEAERQEVAKNRVENKSSTPVERDGKGILGHKLVNKQVLWLSVGFLSILLLLSVPYLVKQLYPLREYWMNMWIRGTTILIGLMRILVSLNYRKKVILMSEAGLD